MNLFLNVTGMGEHYFCFFWVLPAPNFDQTSGTDYVFEVSGTAFELHVSIHEFVFSKWNKNGRKGLLRQRKGCKMCLPISIYLFVFMA